MNLNEEQLKSVAAWFAGGASLDEIQKRLVAEFGVHLTYFDLRMIVAELPQPEEATEPEGATGETSIGPDSRQDGGAPEDGASGGRALPGEDATDETPVVPEDGALGERALPGEGESGAANVTVTVDALMIPGTMASGDVVFSDGVKGKWYLDQMGRLGLGGDLPQGYRPSPADAALFQARLMEALRAKGLY